MAPLTTINSKGIEDGAIVNVDVDTSAAIAGTKIDPDFGAQNVETTGTLAGGASLTLTGANPIINLTDNNNNSDYRLQVEAGLFHIEDTTNAGADRFVIDSTGRIGINRASWPDAACPLVIYNGQAGAEHTIIDIVADPNETSRILFSETDDSGKGLIKYSHGSAGDMMTFHTNGSNAAAERLRIGSTGLVGIGTGGNATTKLEIGTSTDAENVVRINHEDNSGSAQFQLNAFGTASFSMFSNFSGGALSGVPDDAFGFTTPHNFPIVFCTNGSEKLRVDNGGSVGIGTAGNIDNKLHVEQSGTGVVAKFQTGGRESSILLQNDARTWKIVNFDFGDNGTDHLGFHDGNHDRMIIQNDGNVKINDGDLIIGTSGHGIDFSSNGGATASGTSISSEHLDHYEEGTWTPAIGNDSNTYSYSVQNGRYTRIGSLLIVGWQINISSGDPDTSSRIVGLPFACADDHAKMKGMAFIDDRESSGLCMVGPTGAGTSMMHIQNLNDAGSSSHTHGYCIMHIH